MDPINNPFAPGAGNQPPELAGRERVLEEAQVVVQRCLLGKPARSQMLLGLRGVGKTVLLNKIQDIAESHGHITSLIEAPEGHSLGELLYPRMNQIIRKLSVQESAKEKAYLALRALRSFASAFKLSIGDVGISVDPELGIADSGDMQHDLPELFLRVGEAVKVAGKAWTLLIDEVQSLQEDDLAALIVSLHKASQKNLPILFFGAGLPHVAALSGEAKSYAERLFHYTRIGPLSAEDAKTAIRQPVMDEGQKITEAALTEIVQETKGYPYFLQEWGYQCWDIAQGNTIELEDVKKASIAATERLDNGFFKVRFDRLTPKEREYVIAMARLGEGPYRSADVAEALQEKSQSLGPRRSQIINKGMIYSPSHGDIAFTVPMFNDYLARNFMKNRPDAN